MLVVILFLYCYSLIHFTCIRLVEIQLLLYLDMLKWFALVVILVICAFGLNIFITNTKASSDEITILLTGDIMLGRSVAGVSLKKNDLNYPFEKVANITNSPDVTIGNLENPFVADCPPSSDGLKFCADPKMISGLNYAGFDIVNLANNHMANYGIDGTTQTENYLKNAGIDYVGIGNIVIKNIKGIKFGFIGFDFVDKKPSDTDYKLVKNSKNEVDILVVMVHWGIEYTSQPTNTQITIGRKLISSGADVVAGSHPHWVQTTEYLTGKPIFYSLGNFVFDQPWSEETKKGLAVKLTYHSNKLSNVVSMPIYMNNFAQPEWINK